MSDVKYAMPSGAVLMVTPARFEDVSNLHSKVLNALRGTGVEDLDLVKLAKAHEAEDMATVQGMVVDRAMTLASDTEVIGAVFKCADKAAYYPAGENGVMIKANMSLFDDPKYGEQARSDYYHICTRVMEVNLRPFFKALISVFTVAESKTNSSPA